MCRVWGRSDALSSGGWPGSHPVGGRLLGRNGLYFSRRTVGPLVRISLVGGAMRLPFIGGMVVATVILAGAHAAELPPACEPQTNPAAILEIPRPEAHRQRWPRVVVVA